MGTRFSLLCIRFCHTIVILMDRPELLHDVLNTNKIIKLRRVIYLFYLNWRLLTASMI